MSSSAGFIGSAQPLTARDLYAEQQRQQDETLALNAYEIFSTGRRLANDGNLAEMETFLSRFSEEEARLYAETLAQNLAQYFKTMEKPSVLELLKIWSFLTKTSVFQKLLQDEPFKDRFFTQITQQIADAKIDYTQKLLAFGLLEALFNQGRFPSKQAFEKGIGSCFNASFMDDKLPALAALEMLLLTAPQEYLKDSQLPFFSAVDRTFVRPIAFDTLSLPMQTIFKAFLFRKSQPTGFMERHFEKTSLPRTDVSELKAYTRMVSEEIVYQTRWQK
ncbi:MAG: hypothetical protein WC371_05160 [Parachlamydiales bacterium]|jgi:hypothetical protein